MKSFDHRRQSRLFFITTLLALSAFCLLPFNTSLAVQNSQSKNEAAAADFPRLVDEYLLDLHSRHPALAAASGIHAWDGRLEDYSPLAIAAEIAAIKRFQSRLAKIPPLELALSDLFDYQIIASNIKSRLLELEQLRRYETNPQIYNDAISTGLLQIALFEYAPADSRLRHVIAKEKEIPRLLDSARSNVTRAPAIFIKTSLESFRGALTFVQNDLPQAFVSVRDTKLQAEFKKSTRSAAKAIADYIKHLERMKPDPAATFALGRENFEAKLRHDEGIDIPSEALLKIAYRELHHSQEEFRRAALQIDRRRDPSQVWMDVQRDHPRAGTLVIEAQKQLETLRRFIEEKNIVTLPDSPPPVVNATPDFMRWATASMWSAGPFESRPLASRYLITDVDAKWSAREQEEYLSSLNRAQLWTTSIHEAYPGHFVQGAYLADVQSRVRRTWALASASFVEGWAHYAEQMIIEEGFGNNDPKIKMGLWADALLRLCRFVVAIRLHTGGMTIDEATRFFVENGYMGETPARIEAERGAFDPTYLVYSVGKLAVMKLRDDYRRYRGAEFSLQEFHDRLLAQGLAPIRVHRQMMMPGDKGKLIE
ncbi:MAG: DUF885 domain-containing protein [Acidobacteriota bacterium]